LIAVQIANDSGRAQISRKPAKAAGAMAMREARDLGTRRLDHAHAAVGVGRQPGRPLLARRRRHGPYEAASARTDENIGNLHVSERHGFTITDAALRVIPGLARPRAPNTSPFNA
jgi:hypothetical protein